jgi:hypothetical protein
VLLKFGDGARAADAVEVVRGRAYYPAAFRKALGLESRVLQADGTDADVKARPGNVDGKCRKLQVNGNPGMFPHELAEQGGDADPAQANRRVHGNPALELAIFLRHPFLEVRLLLKNRQRSGSPESRARRTRPRRSSFLEGSRLPRIPHRV